MPPCAVLILLRGFDALTLAEGLSPLLPVPIPFKPPTNWTPFITSGLLFLVAAIGAKFVLPLLLNRWFWAILSIATCLIMTSGFMFVRIRNVPYVSRTQNGRTQWVAGGAQNQYGMETQVVAAICRGILISHLQRFTIVLDALLSFSCISLIVLVPRIPSKTRQTAAIYIWSGVAVLVLAILMGIFKLKSPCKLVPPDPPSTLTTHARVSLLLVFVKMDANIIHPTGIALTIHMGSEFHSVSVPYIVREG